MYMKKLYPMPCSIMIPSEHVQLHGSLDQVLHSYTVRSTGKHIYLYTTLIQLTCKIPYTIAKYAYCVCNLRNMHIVYVYMCGFCLVFFQTHDTSQVQSRKLYFEPGTSAGRKRLLLW